MKDKYVIESDLEDGKKMIVKGNDNNDRVEFVIQDENESLSISLTPMQVYLMTNTAIAMANRRYVEENRKKYAGSPVFMGLGSIPDEFQKAMDDMQKKLRGE
jgi:hypothetical protein